MKKLSYFIATTLIGSSLSAAHAEPKMSGTIYIMTEVEHNNKTGVTNTTISDKSSSLYLSDEVRLNNDLWLKWQLGSFIYFDSDRWGGWGTADSYVALNSYKNLGTVKMGYISTPMNSIYLNPFDTNSPILEFGKISRFGQRRVSMAYESPWKNGFQFKFNVSPGSNAARNNNDWNPDKKRDGDWVFGWGVDYYHPNNGFNAHYAAEYAPNDSPTETKDFQAHAFMAGYSKDKISVDAAFQYAKNTCDGFSCWGVWKDAAGNVAGSYDKEINNTKEFMVSGSYKVGNFKPQIGFAYGKSSVGEDYKHVAVSTDYSFSKRTTATLGAGWLKENVNPKYDEDLPKKSSYAVGMVFKHRY